MPLTKLKSRIEVTRPFSTDFLVVELTFTNAMFSYYLYH